MKIAGIVLSGGLSSRMGRDKATLKLDEQTLLEKNFSLLSNCSDTIEQVFISGNYNSANSIPDLHKELGPIGGLHACVEMLFGQFDALFIMPVDMPLLSQLDCQYLIDQYKNYPQGVFYQQSTFPMILPLNLNLKKYLSEVLTSPQNKHRSLFRLIKTLKLQSIETSQTSLHRFKNSNTPQEWNECLKAHKQLTT